MKKLALTLLALINLNLSVQAQEYSLQKIFKDAAWLHRNLEKNDLILIHVETEDSYSDGHIPGAQFVRQRDYTITSEDSLYTQLPAVSTLDSLLRSMGINDGSTIVLYYGGEAFAATFRLYYTLEYLGLADRTYILDGGLKAWKENQYPLEKDIPKIEKSAEGSLSIRLKPSIVASKIYVQSNLNSEDVSIIDARTNEYYSGEKDGDGYYKRPGHIAGAKNITWLNIIDENQLIKSEDELRAYFNDQEILENNKVVTYCHVGLRATVLYTIAKGLGHEAKMYDGSFNEWDRLDETYPVEYTFQDQ